MRPENQPFDELGARRLGACDPHRIMSLTALIEEAMALDAANSAAVR